jgi:hypothetical protein
VTDAIENDEALGPGLIRRKSSATQMTEDAAVAGLKTARARTQLLDVELGDGWTSKRTVTLA